MMLWIRGILFTVLVPGTVAGYIPWIVMRSGQADLSIGRWHYAGLLFLLIGISIYVITIVSFILRGKGTPAIWFTAAIGWLIGREPLKLVSSGIYKYSRNPMYVGVMTIVFGEGIYFQYSAVLRYLVGMFLVFHLIVVLVEEPHLEGKFGEEYKAFKRGTRRWL
jgi:protein-S-isoprenylcysteine O-methyltransferase Ste14